MSQSKITLGLTLVLASLAGWYFLYEKKVRPKNEETQAQQKKLIPHQQKDITQIIVKKPDAKNSLSDAFELKKVGSDWHLIKPLEDKADQPAVKSFITQLISTDTERTLKASADLSAYGITSASTQVTIQTTEGESYRLTLGSKTAVGYNVYALRQRGSQKDLFVITQSLQNAFKKDSNDFRNKQIFKDVISLQIDEISSQKPSSYLIVKDKKNWVFAKTGFPTKTANVKSFVSLLTQLRAESFVSEEKKNLASFGLNRPQVHVVFKNSSQKKQYELFASQKGDKYYAMTSAAPTLYEIKKTSYEKLSKTKLYFESFEATQFNRFDISKIIVTQGEDKTTILKTSQTWEATEKKLTLDKNKVDAWVSQLQDLKLSQFIQVKNKETLKPQWKIDIYTNNKNKEVISESLYLYETKGNQSVMSHQSTEHHFLVDSDKVDRLKIPQDLNTWKKSDKTQNKTNAQKKEPSR